jgi:uncharacterized protein with PIN domain
LALMAQPARSISSLWRILRSVCPHCGSSLAHRSRARTVGDRLFRLAGLRLYRCESCGRLHHSSKWLKLLEPLPQVSRPRGR